MIPVIVDFDLPAGEKYAVLHIAEGYSRSTGIDSRKKFLHPFLKRFI